MFKTIPYFCRPNTAHDKRGRHRESWVHSNGVKCTEEEHQQNRRTEILILEK